MATDTGGSDTGGPDIDGPVADDPARGRASVREDDARPESLTCAEVQYI